MNASNISTKRRIIYRLNIGRCEPPKKKKKQEKEEEKEM